MGTQGRAGDGFRHSKNGRFAMGVRFFCYRGQMEKCTCVHVYMSTPEQVRICANLVAGGAAVFFKVGLLDEKAFLFEGAQDDKALGRRILEGAFVDGFEDIARHEDGKADFLLAWLGRRWLLGKGLGRGCGRPLLLLRYHGWCARHTLGF